MTEADSTTTSVSNLDQMDDTTKRYLRVFFTKQQLLAQVRGLTEELNTLKDGIMDRLLQTNPVLPVCPSATEENVYGGIGSLVVKVKNDYENLTRDTLNRLLTEFYEYLTPETSSEELKGLAEGVASWLWHNRKRHPVRYLDRTFVLLEEQKKKKKRRPPTEEAGDQGEKPSKPKRPRFKPSSNMPHSREDFLALPSIGRMLTMQTSTL